MARRRKREVPKTREEALRQARRFLANGRAALKKSPVLHGAYQDSKYVREGAAMAYLAALMAIDGYLLGKGKDPAELPSSIEGYQKAMKLLPQNGKLKNALTVAYQNLHIFAYYRGGVGLAMVKEGFDRAEQIIKALSSS